jgi:hypothetical protein
MDDLRFVTRMPIEIAVASQGDILRALEKYYPKLELKKDLDLGTGLEDEIEFIHQEEQEEDNIEQEQDKIEKTWLDIKYGRYLFYASAAPYFCVYVYSVYVRLEVLIELIKRL